MELVEEFRLPNGCVLIPHVTEFSAHTPPNGTERRLVYVSHNGATVTGMELTTKQMRTRAVTVDQITCIYMRGSVRRQLDLPKPRPRRGR